MKAMNEMMENGQFLEKAAVDKVGRIVDIPTMNLQVVQIFREDDLCVCEQVW